MTEGFEDKLKGSVFFIEATDYEQFCLWKQYHETEKWISDPQGFGQTIGHIDGNEDRPVYVSFSFAHIHGKRICFYRPTSRWVDNNMVDDYIYQNYPIKWDNGTRRAMCDAQNFHHAIDRCENEK